MNQKDVLINAENMYDHQDQDLTGMEAVLLSELFNMDTIPEELPQKPILYKKCRCGNTLFESPKGQFRCGCCGNIIHNRGDDIKK